jgi:plasmid stabilization system protein ParE
MKRVIWTPVAKSSLQETVNFISEIWNDQVIDEFLSQLDYRIEQIQRNPELAPTFKNSEFRQLIVHESVSLFYRNDPEYLKLLLVWDNRQDPAQLLVKLTDASRQ